MTSSTRIDPAPPPETGRSSSMWSWLLPVLTFLLGCLLGAVVVAAGTSSDAEDLTETPAAAPTPSATGSEDGDDGETDPESEDVEVQVPESCLAAADGAVVAANRIDDVVGAVRDLDARRLQEIVDEVQEQQPQVRELAERCRSTAGERIEDADLTPVEPSATPSS